MKANKMTMCGVFAAMAAGAFASDGESSKIAWAPGEGVTFGETPVVSAEVSLSFDSRYMTYGVIDGKDPIFTPGATATFFDWAYIGVESIFDLTDGNGKRGDLVFHTSVEIPKGLNKKQKEAMKAFADSCDENQYAKHKQFFKKIFGQK